MPWREICGCRRLGIHMGFNKINTMRPVRKSKIMRLWCSFPDLADADLETYGVPPAPSGQTYQRLRLQAWWGVWFQYKCYHSTCWHSWHVSSNMYVPHNNVSHTARTISSKLIFFWKTLLPIKKRNKNRLLRFVVKFKTEKITQYSVLGSNCSPRHYFQNMNFTQ